MKKTLNFSIVGITPENVGEMLKIAKKYGFDAIEATPAQVSDYGLEQTLNAIKETGVEISSFGMPFRPVETSNEEYAEKLELFKTQAKLMADVGAKTCFTFVRSSSDDYEFEENYKLHIERWRPVAQILKDNGMKLALEFLGPLTSQQKKKYPFMRTAEELLPLCKEMGDNVGLLFDFWHWYSGANNKDVFDHIEGGKYIYHVHLNDALNNDDPDTLMDKPRKLVGTSGVIDTKYLVTKLKEFNYSGSVVSESFSDEIKAVEDLETRVKMTKEAIDKAID